MGSARATCTACRQRTAVAKGLCLRCYRRARAGRPVDDTELERYGQPDGHDHYGILDDDGTSVLCHECGHRYRSLGAHVSRAHGMSAAEYKTAHGLSRSRSLAATALRETFSQHASARVGTASWQRFENARDPQAAAQARTFPPAPAQTRRSQATQSVANSKASRKIVVRTCPGCGAQWCPLPGGYARKTCRAPECIRALASRATREHARRHAATIRPLTGHERHRLRTLAGPALKDLVNTLKSDDGVSQKTLAAAVGISEAGLSRFLSGHRVPSTERPRPTASTGAAKPESGPQRL
ncbi:MucR family transcriptional regulator [Streptomyces sp. NPDC059631]|uniref:MucR family transcriptional regulator n=1 Tax=unclassified Streptomyces TaxID=2593676 RepID=UPI0036A92F8D